MNEVMNEPLKVTLTVDSPDGRKVDREFTLKTTKNAGLVSLARKLQQLLTANQIDMKKPEDLQNDDIRNLIFDFVYADEASCNQFFRSILGGNHERVNWFYDCDIVDVNLLILPLLEVVNQTLKTPTDPPSQSSVGIAMPVEPVTPSPSAATLPPWN